MDRVRNEEVRRRAGIEKELASRVDQRVLRRLGQIERMDDLVPYGQTGVEDGSKWRAGTTETEVRLDGCVKVALGNRGMTVEPWYICT